jgi:hypothetical protein
MPSIPQFSVGLLENPVFFGYKIRCDFHYFLLSPYYWLRVAQVLVITFKMAVSGILQVYFRYYQVYCFDVL